MAVRMAIACVLVAACSSRKPKPPPVDESAEAKGRGDAGGARDATAVIATPSGPYRVETAPVSDAQVRVEWKDVPLAARASPGRSECGTAKPAAVAPTVTWGIPEVVVVIATGHGKAFEDPHARIVLDRCAATPRVVVAGSAITIASAAAQPIAPVLVETGTLDKPDAVGGGPRRVVALPIAGHEVSASLKPGTLYRVEDDAEAWIVAVDQPYVAVTDASGVAMLRDVPLGTYGVLAWLPPRAGQPARLARGEVTVTAGALAEVTLDLTKP